ARAGRFFFGRRRSPLLRDRAASLHCRTRSDAVEPALHVRKVIKVNLLPLMACRPGKGRDIGHGIFVPGQPFRLPQTLVQDTIEAPGFVTIALLGIGDVFRRKAQEVMSLAEHRAKATHLPHQPLYRCPIGPRAFLHETPCFPGKVEQDGPRLEKSKGLSTRSVRINYSGNLVVGADLQEFRIELLVLGDVDGMHFIWQSQFFQGDGNLVTVGSAPGVKGYRHRNPILLRVLVAAQPRALSACSRSAARSSICSRPIERRRRLRGTGLSGPSTVARCSIKLSTPPNEVAGRKRWHAFTTSMAAASPPRTSKLSIPPKAPFI